MEPNIDCPVARQFDAQFQGLAVIAKGKTWLPRAGSEARKGRGYSHCARQDCCKAAIQCQLVVPNKLMPRFILIL